MRGRVIPLSRPRRVIADLMHFAAGVPTVPVQRMTDLAAVAAARAACPDRPPWSAVFAKAFALVAREFPPLRRAYCKFPTPHLYEYPGSVAAVTVERDFEGEKAVFVARVKLPEDRPLADVAAAVRFAAQAPVTEVKEFRRVLGLAGLPRPVRRLVWWVGLNVGRQRPNYFGTFGVSAYAALGAESLHPLSPLTATINFGRIAPPEPTPVRVVYDHRVTDGGTVARALVRLEEVLNGPVAAELRATAGTPRRVVASNRITSYTG